MNTLITGHIELTEEGWLHIRLDTLLPHCKYGSVSKINDAVFALLEQYDGTLPYYDKALLVIDEHCDDTTRRVFDQDNKGWKAIPNTMKGLLFEDDDQFTLWLLLVSTRAPEACCHIYLLPQADGARFFAQRAAEYPTRPPLA